MHIGVSNKKWFRIPLCMHTRNIFLTVIFRFTSIVVKRSVINKQISHHSSVYRPFHRLLLFLRSDATTAARIDGKIIPKPWSQQNPFLSLKIQAWCEIIWFEMLRTDHLSFTRSTHRFVRLFSSGRSCFHKTVCYQA